MPNPSNKTMTLEDEKFIVNQYINGNSALTILKMMNYKFKTTKSVYDILKKFKIETKDCEFYNSVDHFYFSEIDNAHKAYVLGWILSDGWVQFNYNQIGIQLSIKDKYIIDMIKKEWKSENKLTYIKAKEVELIPGKVYDSKPLYRIMVHSSKMIEDLKKFNIVDRKSLTLTMPILKNYMADMLRGWFDGDGCAYFHSTTKTPIFRFNGSHYSMAQIALYLHLVLKVQLVKPMDKGTISAIEWYLPKDVKKIKEYFYYNNEQDYYLERKYEYFKNI